MRRPKHPTCDRVLASKAEEQGAKENAQAVPCDDCGPNGLRKVSRFNRADRKVPGKSKPSLCSTCGGYGWTYTVAEPVPAEKTVLEMVDRHDRKVGWSSAR